MNKETKDKAINLFKETVEFYSKNPNKRAVVRTGEQTSCSYLTMDGRSCAIGRLFPKSTLKFIVKSNKNTASIVELFDFLYSEGIDLPDVIKGIPVYILGKIQIFHDKEEYWCSTGLSDTGIKEVENILRYIENYEVQTTFLEDWKNIE